MIAKVCGLTPKTDLGEVARLERLRYAGLIFVADSPRYVGTRPFALEVIRERPGIKIVGVFRDTPLDELLRIAGEWSLDGVQLHGAESPNDAAAIREAGYLTLKALGVTSPADVRAARDFSGAVDLFVFDTPGGGTGRTFSWRLLDGYDGAEPFLLAGGIGPGSGPSLASLAHPRLLGVDLNSRFEHAPGKKNIEALQTFLSHELPR